MQVPQAFKMACLLCAAMMQTATSRAQLPTITNQPTSRALWAGGTVMFAVGVSGTGPFAYQWQLNNTNLPNCIITTVAGNGTTTYSGEGGAATAAGLYFPEGVVIDVAGNIFIADSYHFCIRKVNTNGIITTFAGNGTQSYSGDGGIANKAGLNLPSNLTLDASGNLFIADYGNQRIRRVSTNGIITTVAGNGTNGYSGDTGAATNASLSYPNGVAVDATGNLFIADRISYPCIRKVDINGIITTFAGNGTNGYSGDGGAATNAHFNWPSDVALDASDNLFITDYKNNRIREVSTNGIITTYAGNDTNGYSGDGGAATNANLYAPNGVVIDASNNLFFSDYNNHRIRKVNQNGIISTVAGGGVNFPGDGDYATNAIVGFPCGIALDSCGNIFITLFQKCLIQKVTNTQGPALGLNNVTVTNAGNYQLVVTGSGGSVTSSVVTLIVASSPLIYRTVRNSDGSVALNFVSRPGSTNVVSYTTNLLPPIVWQALSTNIAGADGNWQFTDITTAYYQTKFYRSLTH
jgi:sugar lactone lactonase YvrE